jgi:hypothetical protein
MITIEMEKLLLDWLGSKGLPNKHVKRFAFVHEATGYPQLIVTYSVPLTEEEDLEYLKRVFSFEPAPEALGTVQVLQLIARVEDADDT